MITTWVCRVPCRRVDEFVKREGSKLGLPSGETTYFDVTLDCGIEGE